MMSRVFEPLWLRVMVPLLRRMEVYRYDIIVSGNSVMLYILLVQLIYTDVTNEIYQLHRVLVFVLYYVVDTDFGGSLSYLVSGPIIDHTE